MIDHAKLFATEAHEGQLYAGDQPYTYHLEKVAGVLKDFGFEDTPWREAAWLHDVVEDTDATIEEVRDNFGDDVAVLVWAVTGVGANRKEKQASIMKKLHENKAACPLKVADRIANLEAAIHEKNRSGKFAMYAKEQVVFEKVCKRHVPTSMWDRLCDCFEYGRERGWC